MSAKYKFDVSDYISFTMIVLVSCYLIYRNQRKRRNLELNKEISQNLEDNESCYSGELFENHSVLKHSWL
jgi:ABC-type nickel/cobalt efflux system permease component RcnA